MPQGERLPEYDERVGTFLDDDVELRDPEGWLLKADYNARFVAATPSVSWPLRGASGVH
jgi:hypothetical protein